MKNYLAFVKYIGLININKKEELGFHFFSLLIYFNGSPTVGVIGFL